MEGGGYRETGGDAGAVGKHLYELGDGYEYHYCVLAAVGHGCSCGLTFECWEVVL